MGSTYHVSLILVSSYMKGAFVLPKKPSLDATITSAPPKATSLNMI